MNSFSNLYQKINYAAPTKAIVSTNIYEFDIAKANINILLYYGVIDVETYTRIYNLDRYNRQRTVGILLKNKEYSKILSAGIIEFKRRFFEANNIQDSQVLLIKNDAIYLIDKLPTVTKFDNVEFVCKNKYSSFYKLEHLELYYNLDLVQDIETLDIKGISDIVYASHKDYMIDFLKAVCYEVQVSGYHSALSMLSNFANQYLSCNLPIEFYRELNPRGVFRLKKMGPFSDYHLQYIMDTGITVNDLAIECNMKVLNQMVANIASLASK